MCISVAFFFLDISTKTGVFTEICRFCQIVSCLISVRATDKRIACDEEFSDSEDEGEGRRKNVANHKKSAKRPKVDEDKKDGEEKKTGELL